VGHPIFFDGFDMYDVAGMAKRQGWIVYNAGGLSTNSNVYHAGNTSKHQSLVFNDASTVTYILSTTMTQIVVGAAVQFPVATGMPYGVQILGLVSTDNANFTPTHPSYGLQCGVNYFNGQLFLEAMSTGETVSYNFVPGQWYHLELYLSVASGTAGAVALAVNGVVVTNITSGLNTNEAGTGHVTGVTLSGNLLATAPAPPVVVNGSFETPVVAGTAPSNWAYTPSGATWAFSGTAGIAGPGSIWSNPASTSGSQVAILQGVGSFAQTFGSTAGTYVLSFVVAQRPNTNAAPLGFNILLDGVLIQNYTPSSTTWTTLTPTLVVPTTGNHTLSFVGLDNSGHGNTCFIDNITITQPTGNMVNLPVYFDDFYILSNVSGVGDFLGPVVVETSTGVADGSKLQWTPSTGTTSYQCVNDTPEDFDTSYIHSNTVGNASTVKYPGVLGSPADIYSLQLTTLARKDGSGTRSFTPIVYSGGVIYQGGSGPIPLTSDYQYTTVMMQPIGGSWTTSVINAAEFGVELTA
jgi:hypothetical protein